MKLEDRITELNFDTDNEEAQKEAKLLKKKITLYSNIVFYGSILGLLTSFGVFLYFVIIGVKKYDGTLLYSIIPLVFLIIFFWTTIFASFYKRLAKDIIIIEKENG